MARLAWIASELGSATGFPKTDIIPQKPSPTLLILEESQPTPLGLLLPPAAAEGFVQLHKALELVAAVLRQGQLGVEQRPLVVEDLEVGGDAAAVALERCAYRIAEILKGVFLRFADFVILLITDQSVRDVPEGQLDGLFVSDQILSLLRLSVAKVPAESTAFENRLSNLPGYAPGSYIGV